MPGQRDMLFTSKKKKEKNVFHKTVETVKIKFNKQVVVFKSKWQELKPTKSINVLTTNIFSGSIFFLFFGFGFADPTRKCALVFKFL